MGGMGSCGAGEKAWKALLQRRRGKCKKPSAFCGQSPSEKEPIHSFEKIAWWHVTHRWCEGRNSINRPSCSYQRLFLILTTSYAGQTVALLAIRESEEMYQLAAPWGEGFLVVFPFPAHSLRCPFAIPILQARPLLAQSVPSILEPRAVCVNPPPPGKVKLPRQAHPPFPALLLQTPAGFQNLPGSFASPLSESFLVGSSFLLL